MMWWLALIPAITLVLIVLWTMWRGSPKLNMTQKRVIANKWTMAKAHADPHRRILDADSVIALLLQDLGFQGSMGEKLKKGGKYIPDLNAVWAAHKLRNQIAHEPGMQLNDRQVAGAMGAFGRVVEKFC